MKKASFRYFLVCFASILLILSVLPLSALASETADLAQTELYNTLRGALTDKSEELSALADEYEASGEILTDQNGEPLDMPTYIAFLRDTAERLSALDFDVSVLYAADRAYEARYVKTYLPMKSVADEMAEFLAYAYDLSLLNTSDKATSALVYCYMAAVDDVYGNFYMADAFDDKQEDESTEYSGIGVVVIQTKDGYAEVVEIVDGSGAEEVGLLVGDVITAVDGVDFKTLGYQEAIDRVRGEVGSHVSLTVQRGEQELTYRIERRMLINYSVYYRMLSAENGTVGYIRISSFAAATFTQFKEAVEALEAQGAKKFVFDVRNNLGGRLDAVLAILEYITPNDAGLPLVRLRYKDESFEPATTEEYLGRLYPYYPELHPAADHEITAPIAVLCNGYTASAGELFTACLRDFDMAKAIGVNTYGKGTGQTAVSLGQSIQLNLSTFFYDPPTSDNYEGIGITPDVTVELPEEAQQLNLFKLTEELDTQLAAALSYLSTVRLTPSLQLGIEIAVNASGEFTVMNVENGSVADRAGIRVGDVLLAVDGVSVNELGFLGASNALGGEEGDTVTLTIKRGKRVTELSMRFSATPGQVDEPTRAWLLPVVIVISVLGIGGVAVYLVLLMRKKKKGSDGGGLFSTDAPRPEELVPIKRNDDQP